MHFLKLAAAFGTISLLPSVLAAPVAEAEEPPIPATIASLPASMRTDLVKYYPQWSNSNEKRDGALTRRVDPTPGVQVGQPANNLVIRFIQGNPAATVAVANTLTTTFISNLFPVFWGRFITTTNTQNPLETVALLNPNAGATAQNNVFNVAISYVASTGVANWFGVSQLAGNNVAFQRLVQDAVSQRATGLQTALFEVVNTATNQVVAVVQTIVN
ncbi:hypothetical protein BJ170DRAFT_622110 [Xylariales sp. AK1849]|nr:hypothetical protein BJ170DRAFT_622110 [Xylariales sp. AK1849]